MRSSAFSGLSLTNQGAPLANGVDQRLFGAAPERPDASELETTEQRAHETTLSRDNETTGAGVTDAALPHVTTTTNAASTTRSHDSAGRRSHLPTSPSPSQLNGERGLARTVERHSHDIFQDQVRWMNRLKLDLEERYDAKVTSNAMVQLALDLFREDFVRNGAGSNLISVLVHGRPWQPEIDGRLTSSQSREEADR